MAPSKRRKTSAAPEPTSGNATQGVRTRHSASARGDVPDAPDADLDAEPEVLLCPITRAVFRDPVMVGDCSADGRYGLVTMVFWVSGLREVLLMTICWKNIFHNKIS